MNRLLIIGNGFDLAHNLPTKYSDFLNWYWSTVIPDKLIHNQLLYEDKVISLKLYHPIKPNNSYTDFLKNIQNHSLVEGKNYTFKNSFFINLCRSELNNWVDIEMFYKNSLKTAFNKPSNRNQEILKLNEEFYDVCGLFNKYLFEIITPFEKNPVQIREMKSLLEKWEQGKNYTPYFKDNVPFHLTKFPDFLRSINFPDENYFNNTYILCFNYTNTIHRYLEQNSNINANFIHGHYQNELLPIVFGYGDESDELFPQLEEVNRNEYLKYTKSVSYLRTQSYNNLMNFIESDDFVVEVMGHSLAISDRTLLKTIFENDKCQYIFLYYHQREDGSTDFFDKSVNISRHFSDKKMLRKKVAPEVFCCPLPQLKKNDSI